MADDQPLKLRPATVPPQYSPPVVPSLSEPYLRRPAPYALTPSSLSSSARFSDPRSLTSSHTSYSSGEYEQNHINIGIDFGTTYSGIAWGVSGTTPPEDVKPVIGWADSHSDKVKVPTKLYYDKNGNIKWGRNIPADADPLQWFKLLLLKDEDITEKIRDSPQLRSAKERLKKENKPVVQVIADYLRQLWDCAMESIKNQLGSGRDGMPFRIVVTVPAIWKTYAQEEMRNAVRQAGLLEHRSGGMETKLEFVAEPEAAALATFSDRNYRRSIRSGDIIVICDAGGGTVDVVTYKVERTEPALKLAECVEGDADLCGSIFIDQEFVKYIEGLMGAGKLAKLSQGDRDELMEKWEHNIKRQYEHNTTELPLRLPDEVSKAIKMKGIKTFYKRKNSKAINGKDLNLGAAEIRAMFDPVMGGILPLTNAQVTQTAKGQRKRPKSILLVGGLGGNKFLKQRLEAEYAANNIELLQPEGSKSWSSICRGAVIKGMSFDDFNDQPLPVVTSYIAKAHYGTIMKVPFDESKHSEDDKKWDDATNQFVAYDQMQWYVSKGDDVSQGDPKTLSWEINRPESRPCTSFTLNIFECEKGDAPTRRGEDVVERDIISFPIDFFSLPVVVNTSGKRFRKVQFDLKMTILGLGRLDFAVWVDGRPVAQTNVSVKLGNRGEPL